MVNSYDVQKIIRYAIMTENAFIVVIAYNFIMMLKERIQNVKPI